MLRASTGLLALMFVVTTGVAGAALHLCAMEGLIVRTCCCHGAHDGPPVQLKRVDDCCGALMSSNQHPPVAKGSDKGGVDAPMASAVALNIEEPCAQPTEAGWIPLARGSPGVHGPPLFVWHCSYLN
ncbi:MAG: hypothetical protein OEN21_13140 [Myxococcales bacterium]|nr:hypothetical protein [Myxococcales bacterium]